MLDQAVQAVLAAYPTIHAACRRRSVTEPGGGRRLSPHLAGILEQLDPQQPLQVGALAHRLRVTPATISLQLNRLARLRLVHRSRSPEDARRVLVRLTDTGRQVVQVRSLLDPERVRAALAQLPEGEQDAVAAGLRLLARAAGQLPADDRNDTARHPRARRVPPR